MNDTVEIKVPDIGDFKDIDVIEVLVKSSAAPYEVHTIKLKRGVA